MDEQRREAGWYPDPEPPPVGPMRERWWDGTRWTGVSRPVGGVELPPVAPPMPESLKPVERPAPSTEKRDSTADYFGTDRFAGVGPDDIPKKGLVIAVIASAAVAILLLILLVLGGAGDLDKPSESLPDAPFAFIVTADGKPVGFDPCKPITISHDTAVSPDERARLRSALIDLARASGLALLDGGEREQVPQGVQSLHVRFVTGNPQAELDPSWNRAIDEFAATGLRTVDGHIAESVVLVDAEALSALPEAERSWTYLHSLGHAVGLDHVSSTQEVMTATPSVAPPTSYQAGDLAGLKLLGPGSCSG